MKSPDFSTSVTPTKEIALSLETAWYLFWDMAMSTYLLEPGTILASCDCTMWHTARTALATLYPFVFSTSKVTLGTTRLANLDRTFYGDGMVPLCARYSDCM